MSRRFTRSDRLVDQFDTMLRTLVPGATRASRACPGGGVQDQPMTADEKRYSIASLRHQHRARVMGQGLYQGQRLVTGMSSQYQPVDDLSVRGIDHLAWCEARLEDLKARPSRLVPVYYAASLGAGVLLSQRDRGMGLGLVNASESLQAESLERQLTALPLGDNKSRAVMRQMLDDCTRHSRHALESGGQRWPEPVRWLLSFCGWGSERLCLRKKGRAELTD